MKKRIIILILSLLVLITLSGCKKKNSSFSIIFIDVGQGDSALVECDGHYMLIDGGDKRHGNKVKDILKENGVQHLDILAVSHFHNDHYAGLIESLDYINQIDLTISNTDTYKNGVGNDEDEDVEDSKEEKSLFSDFLHKLSLVGSNIVIPDVGQKYPLGSATVEIVYNSSINNNDSLVLLFTYGKTKFMFTGDIEYAAQKSVYEKYMNGKNDVYKIDMIKVPHHGSYEDASLYTFFQTFMPDYVIISVGAGNRYGHPDKETLQLFNNEKSDWKPKVYRTDHNGDIYVKSNGKEISVKPSKEFSD